MQRQTTLIALILLIVLAAGLTVMPGAAPGQLGALQAGQLLEEAVEEGAEPTHADLILASSAVRPGEAEGERVLTLGVVRVLGANGAPLSEHDGGTADAAARRSVLTALRGTMDPGSSLRVDGELGPAEGGIAFELGVEGGDWAASHVQRNLLYSIGGVAQGLSQADWIAPSKSALIPPLIAILLAVLLRKPVIALALGVLAGTFLVGTQAGGSVLGSVVLAPIDFAYPYFWNEFVSESRYLIIGFTISLLAMIGVLSHSGGIQGMMDRISVLATSAKRTQIVTWFMGLMVFFDDYTNTIVCGATMRPLADRYRISREKLTYLVDSTAAPVAGLMLISTWIAFEVSTFSNQLPAAGLSVNEGYAVFLETLPYRFYCLLTIFFVGLLVFSGRDFGPMLKAERRARKTGQLLRPGGQPMVAEAATSLEAAPGVTPAAWRALVPLGVFLMITVYQILATGGAFAGEIENVFSMAGMREVLNNANSPLALFQGSITGLALAVVIALSAGLGTETFRAAWTTLRSMGVAIVILYLAWMVAATCGDLGTDMYLTALLGDSMHPALLPTSLFVLSGIVSFATGTSWGTMGILLPLVVGLAFAVGEQSDIGGHLLMVMSIGAVLEGSIFGDHCSPISDTTVLSSVACAADHVDHVRTQAPYALVTMGVGIVFGYLPCAFLGMSPYLGLLIGAAVLVAIVFTFGRKADDEEQPAPAKAEEEEEELLFN